MAYYGRKMLPFSATNAGTCTFATDLADNKESIVVQAQLADNPTYRVYYRFDAAPTVLINDGMLKDGDSSWLITHSHTDIRFLLTDAGGDAIANGGAGDNVLVRGAKGKQAT